MKRDHNAGFSYWDTGVWTWSPIKLSKSGFHWHSLEGTSIYQSSNIVYENWIFEVFLLNFKRSQVKGNHSAATPFSRYLYGNKIFLKLVWTAIITAYYLTQVLDSVMKYMLHWAEINAQLYNFQEMDMLWAFLTLNEFYRKSHISGNSRSKIYRSINLTPSM